MAATLTLQTLDTNTSINLLTGVLKYVPDSWATRTAPPVGEYAHEAYGAQPIFSHYPPMVETFDLAGQDTGANLIAAIAALGSLLATARRWHLNNYTQNSVWLHHAATAETAARRALIYEGSLQILAAHGLDPLLDNATVSLRINLTRHPLWEPLTTTTQTASNYTLWANKWVLSSVPGNEPARIRDLQIKPRSGGGGPLYRLWIGLHDQIITPSGVNLDSVWELEDGANEATATDTPDATASPNAITGAMVRVAFSATATHAKRMAITAAQAAVRYSHTNYNHYVGRYLVLCRCRVTAGAAVRLELRSGYAGAASSVPCGEAYIENSAWRLLEIGIATIPHHGYRDQIAVVAYPQDTELQIWAEHISGTAATDVLDLDAICLIPADHLLRVEGAALTYTAGDDKTVHLYTFEDDTQLAAGSRYGRPSLNVEHDPQDFYLPLGAAIIVLAGEQQTQHLLTEANDLSVEYLPRWLLYRSS